MNAAGGVVQNKENKILMINKNNIWDLPKGKVNQGEAFKLAAFREIKEETGVQCARIIDPKPYVTYHIYKDKFNFNVLTLKATTWFFIMAEPSQVLEPQLEEDIVDVKWIDCDDFQKIKTYESIKGPVNFFT